MYFTALCVLLIINDDVYLYDILKYIMLKKKKIVILGGGFGGLYTYLGLKKLCVFDKIDITIVNRTNYFLFTPMLHEVATGGLARHQIVESIRQVIYKSHANLHVAEVLSIDADKQIVNTDTGILEYDILVIALGSTTNFYNTKGAEENSFTLKDLHGAVEMRANFIDAFENASLMKESSERKKELSFGVIGGGPTGVELVAETAELFLDTFSRYYEGKIFPSEVSLYLINRTSEILMPFNLSLRKSAIKTLKNKGIKVLINAGVKEMQKDIVILDDDTVLPIKHIVWTAGVKPNTLNFREQIILDKSDRILTNEFLQIAEFPNIFAIGDVASIINNTLPMLAQVAVKQGTHTAENIKRFIYNKKLLPFSYKSNGELVSLGQWNGIANIKGIKLSGPVAWFLWRTVYLFKFISGSKKLKIAMDWTVNAFYPRDITKI